MIDTELLNDCRRLAADIARREFLLTPPVFVDAMEIGTRWLPTGAMAVAIPAAGCIGELRRWSAGRHLILLDGDRIEDCYGANFRLGLLQVAIHELAHVVHEPTVLGAHPEPVLSVAEVRAESKWLRESRAAASGPTRVDDGHDWRFIRRCAHIWFRVSVAGWDIPPHDILCIPFVAQLPHWVCSLMGELTSMSKASFQAIEASSPPPGFMSMWENSLSFHEQQK